MALAVLFLTITTTQEVAFAVLFLSIITTKDSLAKGANKMSLSWQETLLNIQKKFYFVLLSHLTFHVTML